MSVVVTPAGLRECLSLLSEHGPSARPLAGATDAMVRFKEGHWVPDVWVSLRRIHDLRYIRAAGDRIEIGALATHTDLVGSELLRRHAPLLAQAARQVGAVQIRNAGTVGGNVGTASPAGDTLPALYALGGRVRLMSLGGERELAVEEFFLGPGKTARRPDELIVAVSVERARPGELQLFQKLGPRYAQSISIVNLAMRLWPAPASAPAGGRDHPPPERRPSALVRLADARFAFGAAAPTIVRAEAAERLATSAPVTAELAAAVAEAARAAVRPIDDLRGSADYRREMAAALLHRGLVQLLNLPFDCEPGHGLKGRGLARDA